jgi:hypothetical protein
VPCWAGNRRTANLTRSALRDTMNDGDGRSWMEDELILGSMLDVTGARSVAIHDSWSGYSYQSPILASYDLHRTGSGGFAGTGRLSAALAGERMVRVRITAAEMRTFLEGLAAARLTPGRYEARIDHTDDFPAIEMSVHVADGPVDASGIALLFSSSQGEFYDPWGALVKGELYSVSGEEVGRALASLRRPLKRHLLDQMIRRGPQFPGERGSG